MSSPSKADPLEFLTQTLFSSIIKKNFIKNDFEITSLDIKSAVPVGENFVSKILRAIIKVQISQSEGENQEEKQFHFIIKIIGSSFFDNSIIDKMKAFPKEIKAYEYVIPNFEEIWSNAGETIEFGPKLYHVSRSPHQFFVFEDLDQLNYKMKNRIDGLNQNEIEMVLEKIAKWHAASLIFVQTNGSFEEFFLEGMFPRSLENEFENYYKLLFNDFVLALKENATIPKRYAEKIMKWENKFYKKNSEIATAKENRFNVLNHGDLWLNNVLFCKKNNELTDIKLIDFQLNVYATPAIDLLYFLILSAKPELLVKKFNSFIQFYHENLEKSMKQLGCISKIPTLKEIHLEILKNSFYGSMLMIEGISILQIDHKCDNIDVNKLGDDDADGAENRKRLFKNTKYLRVIEILIPFLGERGMLDIE